jgi:predicted ester cyclase
LPPRAVVMITVNAPPAPPVYSFTPLVAKKPARRSCAKKLGLAAAAVAAATALLACVVSTRSQSDQRRRPITRETPPQYLAEPAAKATVRQMDDIISAHTDAFEWESWSAIMAPFWAPGFVYDCSPYGRFTGLREWFDGEHIPFNLEFEDVVFTQMLFLGEKNYASTTTYAVARWIGPVKGIVPTGGRVSFRICDYYKVNDAREITYNFMMFDMVDLARQVGSPMLPPAPLPDEGFVRPPAVMDGVPAPLSAFTRADDATITRALALRALRDDWVEQRATGSDAWSDEMVWYGPAGFGIARGVEQYRAGLLAPMHAAMGSVATEVDIVACEGTFCGVFGHINFTQVGDMLGEPAPAVPRRSRLRFSFHYRSDGERIAEGYAMFDLPALFAQWGIDLYARAGGAADWVHDIRA